MSEDNNVVAPGLWFSSPLKLDVCKGSFQSAPHAPAGVALPAEIEALLEEAANYKWMGPGRTSSQIILDLAAALRAEAIARQQAEQELCDFKEEKRNEI